MYRGYSILEIAQMETLRFTFGRPAEPSAPKGRRFGRFWRDSRFHLLIYESEVNLLCFATVIGNFTDRCKAPDS